MYRKTAKIAAVKRRKSCKKDRKSSSRITRRAIFIASVSVDQMFQLAAWLPGDSMASPQNAEGVGYAGLKIFRAAVGGRHSGQ